MDTTTIGIDIAKSVFQVSVAAPSGRVLERKRLSRVQFQRFLAERQPACVVLEACATAHFWARTAAAHGHTPRLLHPQYVRPYVRRNKTDAADADALLRAVRDPDLKPVPVKSIDQPWNRSSRRSANSKQNSASSTASSLRSPKKMSLPRD
jgi:transposase